MVPGRVLGFEVAVHADVRVPKVLVIVVYGSNVPAERKPIPHSLEKTLKQPTLLMGDWNATTFNTDTTCLQTTEWTWLSRAEQAGLLIDPYRQECLRGGGLPRHTRARRYNGTS